MRRLAGVLRTSSFCEIMNGFRLVCAAVVFIGAGMEMDLLWNISDVLMGAMALINIPAILLLSGTVKRALTDYENQRKVGKNPVFYAKNIHLKQETDF